MADPSNDSVTEKTKWMRIASSKVRDLTNDARPALPSHQEAQMQAHAAHCSLAVQPTLTVSPSDLTPSTLPTLTSAYMHSSTSIIDVDEDDNEDPNSDPDGDGIETTSDFSRGNACVSSCLQSLMDNTAPGPSKRRRVTSPSASPEPEPEPESQLLSVKERNCDLDEFFEQAETTSGKKYRRCKFCM